MKLGEIAERVRCRVWGDPEIEITGMGQIESAQRGELTFLSNIKYRKYLAITEASGVITDRESNLGDRLSGIISPTPYLTFAEALQLFHRPPSQKMGIDKLSIVSPTAVIGKGVSIGPFVVIGEGVVIGDGVTIMSHTVIYEGVEIGRDSLIHSQCTIREYCRLGERVILQNQVVIGGDGFGYAPRPDRTWHKIPQTGVVVLADDVEVGAGSTIDRATIGETLIGPGTKIDNLTHIGHGSSVGRDTLLCAQVGLAGSSRVGNEVILGGQVGVAGHLSIGDRVMATAQSGIPSSVEPGKAISGSPAIDHRAWLRFCAIFDQIAEWPKEIRELRDKVATLERSTVQANQEGTD
ncbi:MAG: UDP-3-O-(3-hydroxymyristoyl)glucosamine N-acyltransferase [Acidobacteria bacterium]|nr:UDP-3-O-(3-hydroxymyristoyl)glucosamine N-acyltransferase [Acidobacteriota bacterium]